MSVLLSRVRSFGLPAYGDDEVRFVESALDRHRPTHIFEWGTNVGASARLFYEASDVLGFPCEIHTVELPLEEAWRDRDHPGHRYGQWIEGLPIHTYRGEGLETSIRLCVGCQPERPLFFLDGCHEHEVVLNELEVIAQEEPEAVILVHDTNALTGAAVEKFFHDSAYRPYQREDCFSDSGMAALWPLD